MCAVNPVMYQNQINQLPQIQEDYKEVKKKVDKEDSITSVFDVIPMFRRLENVPDKVNNADFIPAAGLISLAVLNAPEDWRDMKSAFTQIKAASKGEKIEKSYNHKIAQHPFSFFRGTLLHKFVNPATSPFPKLANWLLDKDTTLMDTRLGDFVSKKFDIQISVEDSKIKNITSTDSSPSYVGARKFATKSRFGELTARALTRTTKIGALILGVLETAHLIKEISDGENVIKATAKSAINLTSSIAGIGYGGAIGAKHFGPAGSLIGMGVGAFVGNRISKLVD